MNILLVGSGGREHAMARAIADSALCRKLVIAPGNPGTAQHGSNRALDVADHAAIIALCQEEAIDCVVVGPEVPLVAGLVDDLEAAGIRAFGPTKAAAQLEGSKAYTKELCRAAGIPTAAFARFTDLIAAKAYVHGAGVPIVVKADGLAAGKGVVVASTLAEAEAALDAMLGDTPGAEVVVEECLVGEEASVFALCDGTNAIPFGTAQDHKRARDGDTGPNTGGMGAYSPARIVTPEIEAEILERMIRPTLAAMRERGTPFTGFLYAGVMLTADGPKLIEYNVRLGDPEAQVILPRLRTDFLAMLVAARDGVLEKVGASLSDYATLTVVLATRGYPGPVERGSVIRGVDDAERAEDITVFHAGTALADGRLVAAGGRVLCVTASAPTLSDARARAYAAADVIDWPEGFRRSDIGRRAALRGE